MTELPAPEGTFQLRTLINPGACPKCGEFKNKLWYFTPFDDDRFKVGTSIVMSCEECAQKKGETSDEVASGTA